MGFRAKRERKEREMKMSKCVLAGLSALVLVLAGCYVENEKGKEQAILKKGLRMPGKMEGWIAVPNKEPQIKKDGSGISYAQLGAYQIAGESMEGWYACNPKAFAKLTKIQLDTAKGPSCEPWTPKAEKKVPDDKDGWICMPPNFAKSQTDEMDSSLAMAQLHAGQIIPKEMDGWGAIDVKTAEDLFSKKQLEKATLTPKK
jgi:hypothetical protein